MNKDALLRSFLTKMSKEDLIDLLMSDETKAAPKPAKRTATTPEPLGEVSTEDDADVMRVLSYVTGAPAPVGAGDVARDLALANDRASIMLARLKNAGKIQRTGAGRGTVYSKPDEPAAA